MANKHYKKNDLTINKRAILWGPKKGIRVVSLGIKINDVEDVELPVVELNIFLEKSREYRKELEGRLYVMIHFSNLQEYNAFIKYCNIKDNDTTTCDRTHFEIEIIKVFELNYNDSNEEEVLDKFKKIINNLWDNYIDLLSAIQFEDMYKEE